jgi:hypothetical protein
LDGDIDFSDLLKFKYPVGAQMASNAYADFSAGFSFGASFSRSAFASAKCYAYEA